MTDKKHDIADSIKRFDAVDKGLGKSSYIADLTYPNMCFARTIRSTVPRARLQKIQYPVLPEGYTIIDHHDIPGENVVNMLVSDWPFFAENEVNYVGEPIALVVGPEREIIDAIIQQVIIEYETIDPVFKIDDALNPSAFPIYGDDNLFVDYSFSKGDAERVFKTAQNILEETFYTGAQEHIYLEPQGMIGLYEDNRITVIGSMQCPYYIKNTLIRGLGWDGNRIRIVQSTTGGAFGGKEEYPSMIAGHVAFASLKIKKPVKLIFDRDEDIIATTKRHPSQITIKSSVDDKNRVTGIDVDIILDGGAYAGLSAVVLQRSMFAAAGVYNIPNVRVRGRAVATNNVPFGAYRGFGAPQAIFALEMHMRHIAVNRGTDPVDFKRQHFVKQGDLTVTSGTLHHPVKLDEIDGKLSAMLKNSSPGVDISDAKLHGRGTAYFLHGCGFTGSGEQDVIKAMVKLKKDNDNRVTILISNVEMGQGPQTTLRKVVAETLEISPSQVDYPNPDTDVVPDSGPTVASRTAMVVGGLLHDAALKLKKRWNESGEIVVEAHYKHPAHLKWDQEKFSGDAYPDYAWGAVCIDVDVDPVTYEIEIRDIHTVFDIGHSLDEKIVEGQIDGGIAQGIGWASIEKMEFVDGFIRQGTITDYIIPSSKEYPAVKKALIENPFPGGPYGAKGAGELTFVGAAPALAAAVEDATGKKIDRIPITPEYLMEVMADE